ncbi:MAG TPA: hypothetical protein VND41_04330 [Nitrososphaerales archaeon]|nr:hypothetical protein [Nitrososphaerales archaeon]
MGDVLLVLPLSLPPRRGVAVIVLSALRVVHTHSVERMSVSS